MDTVRSPTLCPAPVLELFLWGRIPSGCPRILRPSESSSAGGGGSKPLSVDEAGVRAIPVLTPPPNQKSTAAEEVLVVSRQGESIPLLLSPCMCPADAVYTSEEIERHSTSNESTNSPSSTPRCPNGTSQQFVPRILQIWGQIPSTSSSSFDWDI